MEVAEFEEFDDDDVEEEVGGMRIGRAGRRWRMSEEEEHRHRPSPWKCIVFPCASTETEDAARGNAAR